MKHGNQPAAEILLGIYLYPKICSIWKKGTDNQTDGHSHKQKTAQSVIILPVCKKEIRNCPCHINKPEQIGNNKIFVKWNIIIQSCMHHRIISRHSLLQIKKPRQVQKGV